MFHDLNGKKKKKDQDIAKTSPNPVLVLWDLRSELITLIITGREEMNKVKINKFFWLCQRFPFMWQIANLTLRENQVKTEFSQDETMPSKKYQCNKEAGAS